jgi:hypothetical protein
VCFGDRHDRPAPAVQLSVFVRDRHRHYFAILECERTISSNASGCQPIHLEGTISLHPPTPSQSLRAGLGWRSLSVTAPMGDSWARAEGETSLKPSAMVGNMAG